MALHSNLSLEYHEKQPVGVLTISSIAKDVGDIEIEVWIPPIARFDETCLLVS
jgi:hypothetical protein